MTYLEILGWARKGIQAEKENYRTMQEKALEGQAHDIARHCQERIDALDVRLATLDEIEDIHNRKSNGNKSRGKSEKRLSKRGQKGGCRQEKGNTKQSPVPENF